MAIQKPTDKASNDTVLSAEHNWFVDLIDGTGVADANLKWTALSGSPLVIGTDKLVLDSNNNLGIGTASPQGKLQVAGNILTTWGDYSFGTWFSDGSTYRLGFNTDTTGRTTNVHAYSDDSNEEITFSVGTVGSPTVAMTIPNSGNVGINESSPDYKLDVNGSLGFTPGTSVTPVDNGDVVIEATNNTTLTFKLKGSDGTVRSGTITLS